MNRRHFIHALMLTAGAASVGGARLTKEPKAIALAFRHQSKTPLPLKLTPGEEALAELFKSGSKALYLFGGPILARADNQEALWLNVLLDSQDFPRLKRRLFEFGVEPISTPSMPGSFIKFAHQERIYNVINCPIEEFCQSNHLSAQAHAIPFAHNFLIYDCQNREVADPFHALEARGKDNQREIRLVARPRSVTDGFDCVLSASFEAKLLDLRPSKELQDFERFILSGKCEKKDVPRLIERAVNYLPDGLEILGEPGAARIALSPLIKSAIQTGLGVRVEKIWSAIKRQEPEERPAAFIGLIKEEMGGDRQASGFDDRLTMYLARHGFAMRRSDIAAEVLMNA